MQSFQTDPNKHSIMPRINGLRQLFHSLSGLALVFIISFLDSPSDVYLTLFLLFLAIIIETVRLCLPGINRIFINYFGILMRSVEKHNPTGSLYYLFGTLAALLLFPKEIALFSMTVLAVGDPAAFIIGTNFGKCRIGKKSLEGSLAFLTTSIIAGLFLPNLWDDLSIIAIITGAITGTVVELMPLKLNDNMTIPVTVSAAVYLVSFYIS